MIDIEYSNEQTYNQIEFEYKIKKDKNKNFVLEKRKGDEKYGRNKLE